jgi:hypothetical protein
MERLENRQHESRHVRVKQLGQQKSDRRSSLRVNSDLDVSWTSGRDRNAMKADSEPRPRPMASVMSTQDDYVQRWLAQTTHEDEGKANAELGSRKENCRNTLAIHIAMFSCLG